MKSSMSMDRALFSLKPASCRTLSIFLLMLKSSGTICRDGGKSFRFKMSSEIKKQRFTGLVLIQSSPHHVVDGAVNPVVLLQQLLHCCRPGNHKSHHEVFCFNRTVWVVGLKPADAHLKAAPRVLFFRTKAILTRPSHSCEQKKNQ